jgi:4-amino-4-deoxy-L-arabinose transferase-like glycosyltransferase
VRWRIRAATPTRQLSAEPRSASQRIVLLGIVALALCTAFVNLWQDWYTDPYFAASVQSMRADWHNFFFVSFDPAGFIAIDKPPLALWLQVAVAAVLGFHGLSLLLPAAVAGLTSVAIIYHLVRRTFGPTAALLAALFQTITPVVVACNRSNNMDSLVMCGSLLAAWAITVAVDEGRLLPLMLGTLAVALAFNAKLLQAYVVLPALALHYLTSPTVVLRTRALRVALAVIVLLAFSFVWVIAVDEVPANQRRYVGSSSNNTEMDLVFGYNGLGRITGGSSVAGAYSGQFGNAPGDLGPFRLFDAQLGGQIGWLLPLALAGLIAAARDVLRGRVAPITNKRRQSVERREPLLCDSRARSLVLWGGWLASLCVLYSDANFFHPYNLVMLAPPINALAGIGTPILWAAWKRRGADWWLLPVALAGTALLQMVVILQSPDWLRIVFIAADIMAVVIAAYLIRRPRRRQDAIARARVIVILGFATLLVAPAAWASVPIWHYGNPEFPIAGPALLDPGLASPSATRAVVAPDTLNHFLLAHHGRERFVLATRYGGVAAPVMLATGQAVMDYGGYLGSDHILTTAQVANEIRHDVVRYFWLLSAQATTGNPTTIESWVTTHCANVPARLWQPPRGYGSAGPRLYDCRSSAARL